MTTLIDIAILLRSSKLDLPKQEELLVALHSATPEQLVAVADFLKTENALAEKLYQNYAMKRRAYESGDPAVWNEILAWEKELLESTVKSPFHRVRNNKT